MTDVQPRVMRDPIAGPGDQPWFDGAAAGTLLVKRCISCKRFHHYPRALCPFCMSSDLEWVPARGTGTIHTYSITRARGAAPYCIAFVTLDEGVTMMTNIVDCDLDSIRIGQRVSVVFQKTQGGIPVPVFAPV